MELWFIPRIAHANSNDPPAPPKQEPTANDGLKLLADAINGFTKTIVDAFRGAPAPAPTPPAVPPAPTPTPPSVPPAVPATPTPPNVEVKKPEPVARLVRRGNRLVERPLKEEKKA